MIMADSTNLYLGSMKEFGYKLDYKKIRETIALEGPELIVSLVYTQSVGSATEAFKTALREQGWIVRDKQKKLHHKCSNDVDMVLDLIKYESKIDVLYLFSGDYDMVPLVQYAQSKGIKVNVLAFDIDVQLFSIADGEIRVIKESCVLK